MSGPQRRWWLIGLALALAVALFSPLASSHPDGLERVAEDKGFMERAGEAPYELIPDYVFPGIDNEAVATILAGLVGTGVVFGLVYGLAWVLRRQSGQAAS
jgi:hypothetical protein